MGSSKVNSTELPSSGVHAIIGSLPTWSNSTSAPDALAAEGSVAGTGTLHESLSARTLTPVMALVSLETMYSMLGLHSLMLSVFGTDGGKARWPRERATRGIGGLEDCGVKRRWSSDYLLKSHPVKEYMRDIIVLQGLDGPVGKSRELLCDDLDPDLKQ